MRPLVYRYGAPYIDDPHHTTSWLLVALPSAGLERSYHYGPNGRLVCDVMAWRDIGFDYPWMIDGFHRAGASLITGLPEIRAYLLVGQRPAGAP